MKDLPDILEAYVAKLGHIPDWLRLPVRILWWIGFIGLMLLVFFWFLLKLEGD